MTMKVYISGKITGVPPEDAAKLFAAAQTELESQGHELMSKKALGKDKFGVQKVMRTGDYFADSLGQFALNSIAGLIGLFWIMIIIVLLIAKDTCYLRREPHQVTNYI